MKWNEIRIQKNIYDTEKKNCHKTKNFPPLRDDDDDDDLHTEKGLQNSHFTMFDRFYL